MPLTDLLPLIAGGGFVAWILFYAILGPAAGPRTWMAPAALSALLLAWSLGAVAQEGPLGFWYEHTRSLWGNQIWFDLLFAAGTAFVFLAPEARRVGMRPLPWAVAVCCTGSIGLLAMLARLFYLRSREEGRTRA